MGLTIIGIEGLQLHLKNVSEKVSKNASRIMHNAADKIVSEAKLNTPVDKYNLEQSIKQNLKYEYRGRLAIDITVGGFLNGVDVDLYAASIHEGYDDNKPGKGTIIKRNANPGRIIGRHFLSRAAEDQEGKMGKEMIEGILLGVEK